MNHYRRRPLRQRTVDRVAVAALFLPLYAAVVWAYRGDRKAAHR